MALIKCTECGREISSDSGQCVHCGYKFRVCPECKTVLAAGTGQCAECGYKFSELEKSVNKQYETAENNSASDIIEEWKQDTPAEQVIIKSFKFVDIIGLISTVLFVAIALIMTSKWKSGDPLEKIAKFDDVKSWLLFFSSILCVEFFIETVKESVKQTFIKIKCTQWLGKNNVDYELHINGKLKAADGDYETARQDKNFRLLTECCRFSENPSLKRTMYAEIAVKCIVGLALAICAGITFSRNIDLLLRANLLSQKFVADKPSLTAAAIALLVDIASATAIKFLQKKSFGKWEKQRFTK